MKIARLAIFLTGITGLAIGGIVTISTLQNQQEESVIKTNETLKTQAQGLVDQFYGTVEAVRANAHPTSLSYVLNQAIVKLNQGVPSEVESISDHSSSDDVTVDDRVMKALKSQFKFGDLQIAKVSVGTFDLSDLSNREGIYVATPIYKVIPNPAALPLTASASTPPSEIPATILDTSKIEKISVTLIDPVKAFAAYSKVMNENRDVFLVSKEGRVLAHSVQAYNGTDLKKIEGLKSTLENLFLGAQTGAVNQYQAIDGEKEQIAFVRAGTLPFAVAAEQRMSPAILSLGWFSEQLHSGSARKSVGTAMVMLALALALFSGMSIWLSRELRKQIAMGESARQQNQADAMAENSLPRDVSLHSPASLLAPSSFGRSFQNANLTAPMPESVEQAAANFVENKIQLSDEYATAHEAARAFSSSHDLNLSAQDLVKAFGDRVKSSFTLEAIEKDLTATSTELTESPVLYFRYERKLQNLTLTSVAGAVEVSNYSAMQAYVRKDIEQQIESLAKDGKIASITHYGPMMKLIMSNLNVSDFEAWAVTSDPEVSGKANLIGVIVVLQTGFKSSQGRPVLAKILREGGNYLSAQTNKIRPRARINPSLLPGTNLNT
jgi:hypothetical protein